MDYEVEYILIRMLCKPTEHALCQNRGLKG